MVGMDAIVQDHPFPSARPNSLLRTPKTPRDVPSGATEVAPLTGG